ncbi:chemotaxis protein CheR [Alteromonas sp. McT4-15]|jgi:chemotaxis protein methyltransferase CheR|uniref:CheR family methyltransferase n=1 Tax=Alteromonas sp. McT4-15 TaxID=2881256 RepID=UPI001CF80E15|nr:CheR family methyltransferase [Alteromonas sp. McT4-15]MCB4436027.1 chemotaxis protein CheR [Alteromonas sp. McT4-15]
MEHREFEFTANDFDKVRTILHQNAGICLGQSKDSMVYSRLSRRLRALNLSRFSDYLVYLESNHGEMENFINGLTTNLTSFFREPHHFDTLNTFLSLNREPRRIWCAASSTGEEVYSIAMTVVKAYGSFEPPVEIIATDIDSNVLLKANQGIYTDDTASSLTYDDKKRFFHKGTGNNKGFVRVIPELRKLVSFKQLNLINNQWSCIPSNLDVIFCRNVMIYFDKTTQAQLLHRFALKLKNGGLYFAGHSETVANLDSSFVSVGRTVYQKRSGTP